MGLPGAWIVLLLRAVVVHPAGCALPSPCCGEIAVAFGKSNALGTRKDIVFVAAFPTAQTLARLRIAARVTATVARLATGWVGSPLAGRGSHPLDDKPNFTRLSLASLLSDQPCLVALDALSPTIPRDPAPLVAALARRIHATHRVPHRERVEAVSIILENLTPLT